ncbi:MAG TPA: LemA family protein [Firmicutes bacterium]|nr:LemA family protein [Bacillota bacterium]
MKSGKWIPWLVVAGLVLLILGWTFGSYNTLVGLDQQTKTAWAQVENQLQRRYDLIPNLVETVKGYAKHEQDVMAKIADARSRYAGASTPAGKIQAAGELESALARLLVIVERYPDLKADRQFTQLQDELAGTENRIAVERMRYNEAVQAFNSAILRVPTVFIARMMGFSEKPYFESAAGAKEAPKVDFTGTSGK